jgi:hypothetical protein
MLASARAAPASPTRSTSVDCAARLIRAVAGSLPGAIRGRWSSSSSSSSFASRCSFAFVIAAGRRGVPSM